MLSVKSSNAKWISIQHCQSNPNTWLSYRKTFDLEKIPEQAKTRIAVDSKYWLYINSKLVVFEGGLKRGPTPMDTYCDEVDIAPFLQKGENVVAILVWYFGKNGFSHNSSGKAGLFFDCKTDVFSLVSDASWKCRINPAFQTCSGKMPNYRLSESNILFDARKELIGWYDKNYDDRGFLIAQELGEEGVPPWNKLVKRPIPLWKDFGLKDYVKTERKGDTLICQLPYNAQFTSYFKINAKRGVKVEMMTDNFFYFNAKTLPVKAEYIAKDGVQSYESSGWMNGHKMYYIFSEDVEIADVKFRETGYNAEQTGKFNCSDPFFNKLWQKSARTLYLTMRDSYMDCPDRERAQWTGDAVTESGVAFYVYSNPVNLLTKKWLYEIVAWQKPDGALYAPVPSGNWSAELPGQVLATVGYYGLWNYYMHTGDRQTIEELYPAVKRYISLWETEGDGTTKVRETAWIWGDWGTNIDKPLLFNGWYYLALKGMKLMSQELGYHQEAMDYENKMISFKNAFNLVFWKDSVYRSSSYNDKHDDRGQALAVVSGLADTDKYPAILKIFSEEEHASPYMEKYVFEAMMLMGYEKEALERHKKRFSDMVSHEDYTTLFEGWKSGSPATGGGTLNHAWSGGGLTVLSQYLCGVYPLEPGYDLFTVLPQCGPIKSCSIVVPSVKGDIYSAFNATANHFYLEATIPMNSSAVIGVPKHDVKEVKLNEKVIWRKGRFRKKMAFIQCPEYDTHIAVTVPAGEYKMESY
ncbi:MAG: alpha-L-rhamnosidase C-terminal domain-containing protein [Paludibacter sp.]|nr:alpha-L-rhamnosidase C-terminal domain-containing protein [Paludibacter sp.]